MNINVIIPTRGDRPQFLKQAYKLIKQQTVQPTNIFTVESDKGITANYRAGYEKCKRGGIVVPWEDDDFYKFDYIETMLNNWDDSFDILGVESTIYYHLKIKKYKVMRHPGRASMMNTVLKAGLKIDWPKDSEPFLDLALWKNMKGKLIGDIKTLGIKHGIGLTVGAGHNTMFPYDHDDSDGEYLRAFTNSDPFYENLKL